MPSGSTQKKAIKSNVQLDPRDHWYPGPPACPHAAFLFSSLQIKSFRPLLLESTCAFILRVNPRTLNTRKFLYAICPSYLVTYEGTLLHLRLVQVVPNWRRLLRK
jgi:hypothetical protein